LPPHGPPRFLEAPSLPVGVGDGDYHERTVLLEPASRLYLYSDGLTDATNAAREPFGKQRLLAALAAQREQPLDESVAAVLHEVHGWCGVPHLRDDVSILALEFTGAGSVSAESESPRAMASA
jgi:phosphoserine phosphatase RsbU/P